MAAWCLAQSGRAQRETELQQMLNEPEWMALYLDGEIIQIHLADVAHQALWPDERN